MVFRFGAEQRLAAADANVRSFRFSIGELAAEGRFRSLLARDLVLLVGQFRFPLGVWFLYFVAHGFILHRVSRGFTARNSGSAALDGGHEPFNNQSELT